MKRVLKLFVISLILGIALIATGSIMINKAQVNMGQIYDIIEENIQADDRNVTFEQKLPPDEKEISGFSSSKNTKYLLNGFNTIEVFAQGCSVEFQNTDEEDLTLELKADENVSNGVFLRSSIKEGTLIAVADRTDKAANSQNTHLIIGIPENYKGGYSLNFNKCKVTMPDIESSMDMSFNILDCDVSCNELSAGDIKIDMSNTIFSAKNIIVRGNASISTISTTLDIGRIKSAYLKLSSASSTDTVKNISGAAAFDMQMTNLLCDFANVSGNISLKGDKSSVDMAIKHDSPVRLKHDESYSFFVDKVKWTDKNEQNKNFRYIIDINVKLSLVTLREKE